MVQNDSRNIDPFFNEALPLFLNDAQACGPSRFASGCGEGERNDPAGFEGIQRALSAIKDGVWDWRVASDEVACSPEYFGMLGYPAAEALISFEGWLELMHPADREGSRAVALDCQSGVIDNFTLEFRLRAKDGSWRRILSRGICVSRDEWGKALRIVGTHTRLCALAESSEDLRKALNEKELLLKEVHHRIKNNMAMVQSMLSLQADMLEHSPLAKDALKAASGRVHGMVTLYAKIYEDDVGRDLALDDFVNDIVEDLLANAPNASRIRVRKRLEAVPISPKCLSGIGIVLNELITNAIKHAFPGERQGTLELEAYAEGGRLRFSVRDDGEGLPEGCYKKGFGLLMAESLVEQLGGQLRHESSGGTRFSFELIQNSCS